MNSAKLDAKQIFLAALDCATADELSGYLEEACGGDAELRARVEQLLSARREAGSFLGGDWTATTEAISPLVESVGTVIGSYNLLQQIGEGGMGVVFMAEQTKPLQRTVALKIIKPGMDTRQVIARFEAERQALAMMDHPNIARVLDAGTTDAGRPYFVMDLVKGVPITDYCDQQHLSIRERLELMTEVCQAVQHAHQKGIIHRDIKPSNVLVAEYDGKPVPKIIDFGVAKATAQQLTEKTMFTEYGQLIGTFEYMSPEQARFNQLDVDTRSDIYSLGVLLYEVLAGSTPLEKERFRSAAFAEVLRIICDEEPPRPSLRLSSSLALPSISAQRQIEPAKLKKLVAGELDWIVMKCLEKDRNRRYETSIALAADLQRYLNDETVQARPVTRTYQLKKFVRRNKAGVLTATAILTALIVGIILASVGLVQARRQARIANAEANKATAVKNLLQEALRSVDPYASKGSDYTVRELIDDVSANFGNKFVDQPDVEIELRSTIGSAYYGLSNNASAELQLKLALDLARRTYGSDDEHVAAILFYYSQVLLRQSNQVEAEDAIREALRIYRLHKQSGPPFLDAMSWYCYLLYALNKTEEADAVGSEALAIADASGSESVETASILDNLSQVKRRQQDYAAAEQMARRAVKISSRLDGPHARTTANGLQDLGFALAARKKYAESESAFREALAINRRNCGVNHWAIGRALTGLTQALQAQGKEEALIELEKEQQKWVASKTSQRQIDPKPSSLSPKP